MTTQKTTPQLPDIEALSRNASLFVEQFGRTAATYIKPLDGDGVPAGPSEEVGDVVRTLGTVAEKWLADPQKTSRPRRS